jgi:hypothetical protein
MAAVSKYDDWVSTFEPVKNEIDANASGEGCMYETFGEELLAVLAANKVNANTVWTLIEDDEGELAISAGLRTINRQGYFITKNAFDPANPEHVKNFSEVPYD